MDTDRGENEDAVNVMTLHAAKGLEFDTVFLPGWEEGLFPSQRTLDDQGRAGLEEERRLGHVGLTRARKRAKIFFATNRRNHGMWTDQHPVALPRRAAGGECRGDGEQGRLRRRGSAYGASRFDQMTAFGSNYTTPGWQRAQANKSRGGFSETGTPRYGEKRRRRRLARLRPTGSTTTTSCRASPPPLRGRSARGARREGSAVASRSPSRAS